MNRTLGAILLISGVSIGTGMLALPIITGFSGFFPTLILLIFCWIFMVLTGLMIADVNLFVGLNSNLISMSEKTLGKTAKMISWFCYLLIFYSAQAAHITASFPIFQNWMPWIPPALLPLVLTFLFGGFILAGTYATDWINRLMIFSLFIGYFAFIFFAPPYIDFSRINRIDLKPIFLNIPIILVTLGFQNIVPTVCSYLEGDRKKIRLSIFFGTLIPLILYILFEFIVLAIVPLKGESSLLSTYIQGASAISPLLERFKSPLFNSGISLFTFSTLITSFLGIGLALVDFLMDGFKIPHTKKGRTFAFFLAFVFPTLFVYLYPEGFLFSMQFAGIFLIILLGILPCLMALAIPSFWKTPKGKILLYLTLAFFILAEILAILTKWKPFEQWLLSNHFNL